jgi:hypothetical protein
MALKLRVTAKQEIPAEHLALYHERDGAWFLNVEDAVEKAKLDEFRENNISLRRERDELLTKFDGIDPAAVRELAVTKEKLEHDLAEQARSADAVVDERLRAARGQLDQQIATLTSERDTLHARLATIQIDQGILAVATRRGLRATAIPDITARARASIALVNGVPAVLGADGKAPRPGKDGASPMTLEEWLDTQVSEAPHLFEPHAGGGAAGNTSGGGGWSHGTVRNPFKKESWNLTEQVRLQKTDPAAAARLKAVAG